MNICRLKNVLGINRDIEEIREEIKTFLELNYECSTASQNLWDMAKVALRRQFTALNPYIKNVEKSVK